MTLSELKRMIYVADHPYVINYRKRRSPRKNIPELRARIASLRDIEGMKFKAIAELLGDGFQEATVHEYYTVYKKGLDND